MFIPFPFPVLPEKEIDPFSGRLGWSSSPGESFSLRFLSSALFFLFHAKK